ncbi:Hsp20/alpha crystallin family protein [Campylobacter ureolyticus]|uniref:Hsp20/alpha crystallin family protein n=1 Tax=Campylobacter ureolyticus TaxID=827 RepID=A0A9Q4KGE0_9BACT|nr:Hsp20/alpha crystallin family protein [Campylobacter ureolyticus]MCZ6159183.1 Hsp20/alpha crystallin family protein [Campylobacter ureolyticus]MCZ6162799.1 Hsp20/alpha crystallin family protein [Campylobacter ureolyticus]MCZ6164708.1 Hsp20/alpha crystallin family protein [Campylobacter ureolyticus]
MKIKRYEPFISFSELEDKFFNLPLSSEKSISRFTPSANTREDDKAYYIEVDLPGVKKEDVSVDLDKNHISISGERKIKNEIKEDDYYKVESVFGKFSRSFSLPDSVDNENIQASFENGVLEILIPKVAPKVAKKIEIK